MESSHGQESEEKPITKQEIINFVRNPNQIVGNDPVTEIDESSELHSKDFLIAVLEDLKEGATGVRLRRIEEYIDFLQKVI